MRLFKTFFFGYLELKWRRLVRTLILLFYIPYAIFAIPLIILRTLKWGYIDDDLFGVIALILGLPILIAIVSYILKPFVVDESHKIKHKKHKPISIEVNESKNRVENKKEAFENERQDEGIWSSILPKVDEQKDSKYFNNLKFIKWFKSLPISILSKPLLIIVEKIYLERDVIVKWILIIIAMVLGNFILYATGIKN